ncbi:hypothetical protein PWT90_08865 [Aphanocladium album]|nr:hypothetical protein PWT90_08865 [Aphanocladium album]
MVCCFAITQFPACKHGQLHKIGCTQDCADFCEPRQTLLVTKFRFPCSTCIKTAADRDRNERKLAWEADLRAIDADIAIIEDKDKRSRLQCDMRHSRRSRHGWLADRALRTSDALAEEALDAERWTAEYAEKIWKLKYELCEDWMAVKSELRDLIDLKPWDLDVIEESKWFSDYVDSSDGDMDIDTVERSEKTGSLPGMLERKEIRLPFNTLFEPPAGLASKQPWEARPTTEHTPLPHLLAAEGSPKKNPGDQELMLPPALPAQQPDLEETLPDLQSVPGPSPSPRATRELPLSPPLSSREIPSSPTTVRDEPEMELPLSPSSL